MASLIKNRILKHLSKFTKNLSSDKINVSTLRGEGELTNLELNEEVLTDLLELPLWIRLSKAVCNKVSCKIIWTKLKSVPIFLNLDEVLVEMETCEKLRQHASQSSAPSYSSGSKYGFADKVIDGMTVRINSVVINFKSSAFHASLQLSRLCLDSRTPLWQHSDLRMTRLKDPDQGHLLIFKQLEWQTLRIEATADQLEGHQFTPLRLITNQARCRITIKKKLIDCSVVGSRLLIILDELLWVLTDSQLKAASHLINSLTHLIQRATELSHKTKAARKLESSPDWQSQQQVPVSSSTSRGGVTPVDSVLARVFSTYDVHETSYHFYSAQIDLHLCDEITAEGLSSTNHLLNEGGAMQVSLHNLSLDYYPYHVAGGSRKYWLRYKDNYPSRSSWVSSLLADFRLRLMEVLPGESPKTHTPVHRALGQGQVEGVKKSGAPTKATISSYLSRLMSVCVVVRVDDFNVYCVSTPRTRAGLPTKWLSSDKSRLLLPQDMSSVHVEFTQYYYPGDSNLPVPPPNVFIQVNPIQVTFDSLSILWLNAFVLSLEKSQPKSNTTSPSSKVDIRLEALMPRFVMVESKEHLNTPERPKKLQMQISRLTVTNSRIGDSCSRMELGKCLENLQQGELFFGTTFPSEVGDPLPVIDAFVHHALSSDRSQANKTTNDHLEITTDKSGCEEFVELFDRMQKDLLRQEEKKIWCLNMDPIWVDMIGGVVNKVGKPKSIPLLDAFPLTLWIHQKESNKDLHVLAQVQSLVNIQIDHFQYLFILRAMEEVAEVTKQLVTDTCHLNECSIDESPMTCFAFLLPELDLSLLMPVYMPSNEKDDDGVSLNCDSVTPDESNFRSMKESTSEHLNMNTEHETMIKSRSDSLLGTKSPVQNGTPMGSASSRETLEKHEIGEPKSRTMSSDWSQLESVPDNLTRTLASGSNAIQKGFTNLISSLDSAFTSNKMSMAGLDRKWGNSPDDAHSMEDWETLSVRSDLSSDSDQFLMVHLDNQTSKLEDALFASTNATPKVERATEMKEDTPTTTSSSSCSVKRMDLVASCTLRLGKVQIIQHSSGYNSTTRLVASRLTADENGTMTWDEFQTKFSARSRGWKESFSGLSTHPCDIRLRYELGPAAEKKCRSAEERGFMTLVARDVNLSLFNSNVVGIPDLIEDEIIPLPVPLRIYLHNINVHLQDDRPSINVTSPGPIPVDFHISKMSVIRNDDGLFRIECDESDSGLLLPTLNYEQPSVVNHVKVTKEASVLTDPMSSEIEEENQQLRLKLKVMETIQKENEELKALVHIEKVKAQNAIQKVREVEEEISHLEEEKRSLLATRQVLQQELMALETRNTTYSTHNATG